MRTRSSFAQALAVILCFAVLLPDSLRAKTGSVIVTYDYDAFGNLIHSTGSTPNNYLYSGEQFDPDLGLYFNRARYLNTSTGRFWSMDRYEGDDESPLSLHKYLYAQGNPVNNLDASGNQIDEELAGQAISITEDNAPTINLFQTLYGVQSSLTVAAGLGAKVLSDPNTIEEVEGAGEAGIAIVQRSFLQTETILTEAEAEATSLADSGSRARELLNELYTKLPSPNPADIEYHHIVEQGGLNASRFGRALQSFGNIVPLSDEAHLTITRFYASTHEWLPEGMRFRDWMATQDWETQWSIGIQIVKEVLLTGSITYRP